MSPLRSMTWTVDADVDVLGLGDDAVVFVHDDFVLGGCGAALTIDARDAVLPALAQIEVADSAHEFGSGPLAFASLPYDVDGPVRFVVPSLVYCRVGDRVPTITWTGTGEPPTPDECLDRLHATPTPAPAPHSYTVTTGRDQDDWKRSVAAVRDQLRAGVARKAVLARELVIEADRAIPCETVLRRLRRTYPTCFVFALPTGDGVSVIGASPELLVSRQGDVVRSRPLAGTTRRSPDPATDADLAAQLLASHKDRVEHQITIDMVHDRLLGWCSYLDAEPEPSIVSVANVHHLGSYVEGRLSHPLPSAVELAVALHPTPAICGHPRDAATALIAEHEGMQRRAYAGAVGWVDRDGQGEWAVAIRMAEVAGRTARLYAGVGVVEDSDPQSELDETRAKFEAMLTAIVRL